MTKIDGLEIVMTKQMQKMIDKELKKRFEELKLELATRYEELLNMRNMEADQFNDGFNDARAGKLETDHPHYDLDTDNWRLGYAWGMFEPMKEKLAREHQLSDALYLLLVDDPNTKLKAEQILIDIYGKCEPSPSDVSVTQDVTTNEHVLCFQIGKLKRRIAELEAENETIISDYEERMDNLVNIGNETGRLLQAEIGYLNAQLGIKNLTTETLQLRIAELEADRRWIPVSERLPKENAPVLVLTVLGGMFVDFIHGKSVVTGNPDFYELDIEDVTHWMPLPKLPEVQE